jgi:cyanophycin synthetase
VHPDNRYIAETAVMQVGLAVAGVDFITPDISRSWKEVPGYIIEINAAPGFRPHWIADPGRDVVSPILDMLLPGELPSSIPIAAITGSNGKTTTSQMLAHILRLSGKQCGLATTQGVFIDGRRIIRGDLAGVGGAHRIFLHKQVEVAVVESSRRGLLRSGLPFDFCDVGAVLNVTSEHVGTDGIESEDELARIKRLVAERSSQAVVLNAEDERCLAMAEHSPAQNLCLVATDKDNPHIQSHVDQGGHAVVLKESNGRMQIVLFGGNRWQSLIETADIAAGFKNLAFCNVTNAMFAAAIAWEMGISLDFISEGLRTFQSTFENNPGRLNVYDGLPFRVIVDFAHNAAKYKSLLEFVTSLPTKGRKIILITSSGNRVDSHFHEIAHACAGSFEHYFLAGADDLRGRGEFEIQEMIQAGLLSEGVSTNFITVCHRETEAIEKALSYAQEGDTLVLAVKNEVHCWQRITNYKI